MFIKIQYRISTHFKHINFKFNHENPDEKVIRIFYEKIIRNLIANSWDYVKIDFSVI